MVEMQRRSLILLDVFAALGFVLFPQVSLVRSVAGGEVPNSTVWLLSLGAALPLAIRRLWPVPVLGFVLVVGCVTLAAGAGPTGFLAAAYAAYLVAATRRTRPRLSAVHLGGGCAAGAALLTVTGGQRYSGGTWAVQLLFGLLALGATWAAGMAVRERREGLRQALDQAAERAKVEERLRITRDIHDVVTHSVGLIAVRAGVANHVVDTRPEDAKEALAVIEEVSRRALRDLRAVLAVLRQEQGNDAKELRPAFGLADLSSLVQPAEAAGVDVDLRSDCSREPPAGVALSTFRIVQEALTNVVKHAAPTRCRVRVATEGDLLRIDVVDDGPGPGHRQTVPGGGLGLIGMKERVAAHGGTLTAGPQPGGGFRVLAMLPY
jgi:signal transduction histidine kinase